MERGFGDFMRRLECFERGNMVVGENGNGKVVENEFVRESKIYSFGVFFSEEVREIYLVVEDVCMQDMVRDKVMGNEINNVDKGKVGEVKSINR